MNYGEIKKIGVIKSTEPTTGLVDGLMWYQSSSTEAPSASFQVKVYDADSESFGDLQDYTAAKNDGFININEDKKVLFYFDGSAFIKFVFGKEVIDSKNTKRLVLKGINKMYETGYLDDNVFYKDIEKTIIIEAKANKIYANKTANAKGLYYYDEVEAVYKPITAESKILTGVIAMSKEDAGDNYGIGTLLYIPDTAIEKVEDMPLTFDVYKMTKTGWSSTTTTSHTAEEGDYFKNLTIEDYQHYYYDGQAWTQMDDVNKKVSKVNLANQLYGTFEVTDGVAKQGSYSFYDLDDELIDQDFDEFLNENI